MTDRPRDRGHLTLAPPPDDEAGPGWRAPHNYDAEADVLGGILYNPRTLDDVTLLLTPDAFYRPQHELVYAAIVTLYSRTRPVDITTVANQLGTDLDRAGGRATLEQLHYRGTGIADPAFHAEIVAEHAALRRLQAHHIKGLADIENRGETPATDLYQRSTDDLSAIPRGVPGVDQAATSSYARVDLSEVLADIANGTYTGPRAEHLTRRDGKQLLYPRAVHSVAGEPGSGKTWVALLACVQELDEGRPVAFLDFEDNKHSVVSRLINLGAEPHAILERFRYIRPETAFTTGDHHALDQDIADCQVAIIDGITEAMTINGLSPNDNDDVANWLRLLPNRIANQGPAVLQIDHVVKNAEARGRYAIGGQHKLAGITGVAYKAVTIKTFAKGSKGQTKLIIDKDKHGDVGPVGLVAADLHADATDPSGRVYAWLDTPEQSHDEDGQFRPTVLMKRVSDYLQLHGGSTQKAIRSGVRGNDVSIVQAIDALVREGHVRLDPAPRGGHFHQLVTPFEDD